MPDRTTSHQHTHLPSCCRLRRHARNAQLPPLTSSRPSVPPLLPPLLPLPSYTVPFPPTCFPRGHHEGGAATGAVGLLQRGEPGRPTARRAGSAANPRGGRLMSGRLGWPPGAQIEASGVPPNSLRIGATSGEEPPPAALEAGPTRKGHVDDTAESRDSLLGRFRVLWSSEPQVIASYACARGARTHTGS